MYKQHIINIVMSQPPGPDGEFIEVEDAQGRGISIGRWVRYGEYWALRITNEDWTRFVEGREDE